MPRSARDEYLLTPGRPGSPEVQLIHRTQQQHPFLPRPVPWWVQEPKKKNNKITNASSASKQQMLLFTWMFDLLFAE